MRRKQTRYIHQEADWPQFRWQPEGLVAPLAAMRHRQGHLLGRMSGLGFDLCQEAVLGTLTEDVVKTSEIEGEVLDAEQVRSSVARRLGMDIGGLLHVDRNVEGIVEMMLDATEHYDRPLTEERLFDWHASLFPTGRNSMGRVEVGGWRTGPMQVVSGAIGRERVHFDAPSEKRVPEEMRTFLDWFNAPADTDEVLKAGLAHLWFVTVHPFDDGNGRTPRAAADRALARSEGSPQRFYSMSSQIMKERRAYYDVLERTQQGTMDVSEWMRWFVGCLDRAIDGAEATLTAVLAKARFWERIAGLSINDRQRTAINHLVDDFGGRLTTSQWAQMTRCSQDTALRDITDLMERGIFVRGPRGGRSTSYALAEA
ncbi:MAG: Fic family protein [Chloroflexi bacterium]|nr:Fic family protein [Chloroflexota bacterium]